MPVLKPQTAEKSTFFKDVGSIKGNCLHYLHGRNGIEETFSTPDSLLISIVSKVNNNKQDALPTTE